MRASTTALSDVPPSVKKLSSAESAAASSPSTSAYLAGETARLLTAGCTMGDVAFALGSRR